MRVVFISVIFWLSRDLSASSHVLQGGQRHDRSASDDHTLRGPHAAGRANGGHGSSHTGGMFELHYVISEEIPVDTFVGNIIDDSHLAERYSPEILRTLRFRFINQPTTGNTLAVDIVTGHLTTIGRIDRETLCSVDVSPSTASRSDVCKLRFDVALQPVQFFQIIRIVVEILDVNDNTPQFSAGFRHHELLETALLGSTLASPTATDSDSPPFSVTRYRLHGNGDDADFFRLRVDRKSDGSVDVRLVLVKPLDRERRDVHQLVLIAYDGGDPPNTGTADVTVVVVDANDNRPIFERDFYEAKVSENASPMTSVARVVASDADSGANGKIKYQLSAASVLAGYGNFLSIDDSSGDIFVTGPLDRERTPVCHVTVTASDCGLEPLTAEVTLVLRVDDVNDCPPDVVVNTLGTSGSTMATIPEDAVPGTFIAHLIVTDRDAEQNAVVDCLLTPQSADTFRLERLYEETEYQIVTTRSLDREHRAEYQLQVVCTDRGSPTSLSNSVILTVRVADVNDNWPVFTQTTYTADLLENSYFPAVVVQTTTSDADSDLNAVIIYSLGDLGDYFDINSTTGTVYSKTSIDYELNKQLVFTVIAADLGSPPKSATATVSVTIHDVNDEKPCFLAPAYSLGLEENQPGGYEVGMLSARDADDPPFNEFSYELLPAGSLSDAFVIDRKTGRIVTTRPLDREAQSVYQLVAVVRDDEASWALSSTASVTIHVMDRNDNRPVFSEPFNESNTTIVHLLRVEMVHRGAVVIQVKATDADHAENAHLRYSIDNSDSDLFWIDPSTGEVTLLDNIVADNASFSMRVTATDAGTPSLASSINISIVLDSRMRAVDSDGGLVKSRNAIDQKRLVANGDTWTALVVVWAACCSGLVSLVILSVAVVSVVRRRFFCKRVDWRGKQLQQQQQQHLMNVDASANLTTDPALCGNVIRYNRRNARIDKHHHYHHHHHRHSSHDFCQVDYQIADCDCHHVTRGMA